MRYAHVEPGTLERAGTLAVFASRDPDCLGRGRLERDIRVICIHNQRTVRGDGVFPSDSTGRVSVGESRASGERRGEDYERRFHTLLTHRNGAEFQNFGKFSPS